MKTNRITYLALIAAVFASCMNDKPESIATDESREIIIKATLESPESKTVLEGTKVNWMPHDEISLFYGSGTKGGSKFTGTNSDVCKTTNFAGTISVITGGNEISPEQTYFWGLYPYDPYSYCDGTCVTTSLPCNQTAKANSFADDLAITIGRSQGLTMGFWNVCGMIQFSITEQEVTKVKITSNGGEKLTGTFRIGISSETDRPYVDEVIEGYNSIILTPPEGEQYFTPDTDYVMMAIPTTMQNGFTITMTKGEDEVFVRTTQNTITIKRGVIGKLGNVDANCPGNWQTYVHEYVDLGLRFYGDKVLFATTNLGAQSPEEYGDYFMWGDIEKRYTDNNGFSFTWNNYLYYNTDNGKLTKYCNSPQKWGLEGNYDNRYWLCDEDDAATARLGGNWRIPTPVELEALADNTKVSYEWTNDYNNTGVSGTIIKGRGAYAGSSIFLPASGYKKRNEDINRTIGSYWSSEINEDNCNEATALRCIEGYSSLYNYNRCYGLAIRPVYVISEEEWNTFSGLEISSGPMVFNGTDVEIAENWKTTSYGTAKGFESGSTYFNFLELGSVFEKENFTKDDGNIDNLLHPFEGWRLPTIGEWEMIKSTSTDDRLGSTVNGEFYKHWALVKITDTSYGEETETKGMLVFPDNKTINGTPLNSMDEDVKNDKSKRTDLTEAQLNAYLEQGCAFLPACGSGYGDDYWGYFGSEGEYWTSTSSSPDNSLAYYTGIYTWLYNGNGSKNSYMGVRLVRE